MSEGVDGQSGARLEVARAALAEVAVAGDVGQFIGEQRSADGAWELQFQARMLGYPGWRWTVGLAVLDGEPPTVLETELLPGPGSLTAPEWVPWSVRLEEYQAHLAEQTAALAAAGESEEEADSAEDLEDELDGEDFDDEDFDDDLEDELEDGLVLDDFDEDDLDIERDDHGIDLGDDEDSELDPEP